MFPPPPPPLKPHRSGRQLNRKTSCVQLQSFAFADDDKNTAFMVNCIAEKYGLIIRQMEIAVDVDKDGHLSFRIRVSLIGKASV